MTTTPAPKGADIEQQRAEFEAIARQRGLNTARTKAGDRYRWHVTGVAWEFWLSGMRGESGSSTSTSQGAEQAGYGPVDVVGDLVRNLLTLDQSAPIYAAFHVDYQGARRCRTRPISTSWERVIDGKWVDARRLDVPYSVIVWARPQADEGNSGAAPGDALDAATITVIRSSIADYYRALNARQHGELAMDRSFRAIERELGMSWDMWTRAELSAIAASTTKVGT